MSKLRKYIHYLLNYRKYNGISFKETLELCSVPIITAYCIDEKGKKVKGNFLLDTGADFNYIDEGFIASKGLTLKLEDSGKGLSTASDVILDETIKIANMSVSIQDKELKTQFALRDLSAIINQLKQEHGVAFIGIIGSNFFNENKYIIDFECCKIY